MTDIPFDDFTDPRWQPDHKPWPPPWLRGHELSHGETDRLRYAMQQEAVAQIMDAYDRGVELVMLDAPTGSGKTFIAEAVRRLTGAAQTLYVCSDIALQQQFITSFPYAALIKGRANYPTADNPKAFLLDPRDPRYLTAADCTQGESEDSCDKCPLSASPRKMHCRWCHSPCPYRGAKYRALHAALSCPNTSYFLYEANRPGDAFTEGGDRRKFSDMPMVIVDEADKLEGELLSYVMVEITPQRLAKLKLDLPEKVTVPESWEQWIMKQAIPRVEARIATLKNSNDRKEQRERRGLEPLLDKLRLVGPEITNGNWVLTDYGTGSVVFKPVKVDQHGPGYLWTHAAQWLHMSATLLSPVSHVEDLGFDGSWEYITMGSTFPKERRPVRVAPVVNMSKKNTDAGESMPKMIRAMKNIMRLHPDDRILVHTVSGKRAEELCDAMSSPRCMTYNKANKAEVLEKFKQTPGAVLFAMSMGRGVDLPYDACRVIVVTKMPWPYLGDKQVIARKYARGGQLWYTVQALRELIQMPGRGMRAPDDECITYILDSAACEVLDKYPRIIPPYFREAKVTTGDWMRELQKD